MPEVSKKTKTDVKDTGNKSVNRDPWIPRQIREAGYLTGTYESPRKFNEVASYTRVDNLQQSRVVVSITAVLSEELDLAPDLSLTEAAEAAQKFIDEIPDDILDIDLGPGF